jgi:hypothetical protein
MTIIQKLNTDLLTARKARNSENITILSTVIGELNANAKLVDGVKTVTDEEATALLKKHIKGIDEVLKYQPDNTKSQHEKTILSIYLPQMMSEDDLRNTIHNFIKFYAGAGERADSLPTMGIVMKWLKDNHAGQYDGALASKIVKETLA